MRRPDKTLRQHHREHLAAARALRERWRTSLQRDGLTTDAEMRDLRISVISASHYWLNAATEARRQIAHERRTGNPTIGFHFITPSFTEYNRRYKEGSA